jgi:CRISPR-associated protein Csb2
MNYLCITVRWLDDRYHGKNADGGPEWPPSPLRLFQALLASAYRRSPDTDAFLRSFLWLQNQSMPEPIIIAPCVQPGRPFTRFVPNNDSDVKFDRQDRLAAKAVRPTLLLESSPIHYVWELPDPLTADARHCAAELCEIARSITTFGWGVDMAAGTGSLVSIDDLASLPGERWLPNRDRGGVTLRVPSPSTLSALMNRHYLFVSRLQNGCFTDLPPLDESAFRVVGYSRATDPIQRPLAAFSILKTDLSGFRAFDTARRSLTVAGMLKCAAKLAAKGAGRDEDFINSFILGHGRDRCPSADGSQEKDFSSSQGDAHITVGAHRFAYLPLPTIAFRGDDKARAVGSIRRALLTTFAEGYGREIAWSRLALSGEMLIDENTHQPVAVLSTIPANDGIVANYIQPSSTWATVTPVVLPGYDDPAHYRRRLKHGVEAKEQRELLDKLYSRTDALLRKAITQAGLSQELADHAHLEWRKAGFWPGADLADRYGVPQHLKRFPRVHVRIQWRDAQDKPVSIPGPICLGGGRFYGLGLFAAEK